MNVLHLTSGARPITSPSLLADTVSSLVIAQQRLGVDSRIVLPVYAGVDPKDYGATSTKFFTFLMGKEEVSVTLFSGLLPGSQAVVYYFKMDKGLEEEGIYPAVGQSDLLERTRFAVFGQAVLEWLKDSDWQPEIVHGHDWVAGYCLQEIKQQRRPYKTVLTVHDGGQLGEVTAADLTEVQAKGGKRSAAGIGAMRKMRVSQLEMGVVAADWVTTVSRNYAEELLAKGSGYGLESVYAMKGGAFLGILSGLDVEWYCPYHTELLSPRFNRRNVGWAKLQHQHAWQARLGWSVSAERPFYGLIGATSNQDGLEMVAEVLESSPWAEVAQVVMLIEGTSEDKLVKRLQKMADKYKGGLRVLTEFDESMRHELYAASDFMLLPCEREPSGLRAMMAMRYGTIPIVYKTGGLSEVVVDIRDHSHGNGVVFSDYSPQGLSNAVGRSMGLYGDKHRRRKVLQRGMGMDFGWGKAGEEYVRGYEELMGLKI